MNGRYEAWEFHDQKYLGVIDTAKPFDFQMPSPAARLLFFTPVSPRPQVIATSFHVTGGAVELQNLRYDESAQSLSGELLRPQGDSGSIYVRVPKGYSCELPQVAPGVAELKLAGTGKPLHWSIPFQRS